VWKLKVIWWFSDNQCRNLWRNAVSNCIVQKWCTEIERPYSGITTYNYRDATSRAINRDESSSSAITCLLKLFSLQDSFGIKYRRNSDNTQLWVYCILL